MPCSRRDFFVRFGHSVAADALGAVRAVRTVFASALVEPGKAPADRRELSWLRPPGAIREPRFLETCTQCMDCRTACPYDSIRRLGPEFGEAAGTPAIVPTEAPCYLCDDMPCVAACKPGALRPIAPGKVRMGTAQIDEAACYRAHGQPCDYCVTRCPIGRTAIALQDRRIPAVRRTGCTGCGLCAYLCPPGAIRIVPPTGKELNE